MTQEDNMSKRIKACRERLELTQEELGNMLGMQRAAINKYEKGYVENIKRATIKKMSEIFNVSPAWLMGYDDVSEETMTDDIPTEKNALLEYFHKTPELNVLFSLAENLTEEDIAFLVDMAKKLKRK